MPNPEAKITYWLFDSKYEESGNVKLLKIDKKGNPKLPAKLAKGDSVIKVAVEENNFFTASLIFPAQISLWVSLLSIRVKGPFENFAVAIGFHEARKTFLQTAWESQGS